VLPPLSWEPVESEISEALDSVVSRLRALGATVEVTQPDGFGDLREFVHAYVAVISAISSLRLTADERHWQAERCRALGDELLDAWADGLELDAQGYVELFARRERYRAALRSFFEAWDVWLTPANVVSAYQHMEAPFPERLMSEDCRLLVDGRSVVYDRQTVYPSLASFSGHPATAFPVRVGPSGRPIGLQAVGPYLEDRTSIAFAEMVAREVGGYTPPPCTR
jgi:amidase